MEASVKVRVVPTEDTLVVNRLEWFGHIQRSPVNAMEGGLRLLFMEMLVGGEGLD